MPNNKWKRIALTQPEFKGGGGESILAWAIEALKDVYDITVITTDKIDLRFMNSFYRTNLQSEDFNICRVFPLLSLFPRSLYILKRHLVMLYCKRVSKQFDLFFSTQNEMDFGVKGIQYIHFPVHAGNLEIDSQQNSGVWNQRDSTIRRIYQWISASISGYKEAGVRHNLTLVNSGWTKELVKSAYGIESKIIYPPVLSDISIRPWKERENGFVCIGWIRPEKQIEKVIDILSLVRNKGFDIDLHIIGSVWDKAYSKKLFGSYEHTNNWLHFEGVVDRDTLASIIAQHRFGIHGFTNEHFGIAVAEMVKAGCIVFVPDGGGQTEIVGLDDRVIYQNEEDAVEKIIKILQDQDAQELLTSEMILHGAHYSSEQFVNSVRSMVKEILRG